MKIGAVIMLADDPVMGRAPGYTEVRQMALLAEQLGFDSIWLYDHLLYRFQENATIGIWECWSMLSALAAVTGRVEIGTLVLCNSSRNPAVAAKMAHTVDEISGGRLIFGVGSGWHQPEYEAFGLPFDHRVDRFEEALQIIGPLLKDGCVDFSGKYYQVRDCEIRPRGPRPGGPPLLVGCEGPRMLRLTARYADQWNYAYLAGPETFEGPLASLRAACEAEGRDPATLAVTGTVGLTYPGVDPAHDWASSFHPGSTGEVVDLLGGYERIGVDHLIFHLAPFGPGALERLAEAVSRYRA